MKALLVTYNFPPVSSAGVWRTLKLAKYLPNHGVTPAVFTVANPSVPTTDDALQFEVDPGMDVVRAKTLEPNYSVKAKVWKEAASTERRSIAGALKARIRGAVVGAAKSLLFPDPQVLWLPHASMALRHRLQQHDDDVVFITAPPFSQFLLAPIAKLARSKSSRVAVVLDYRDEWITYRESYEMMGRLGELVGGPLERHLVTRAHAITCATEAFRNNLLSRFPQLAPERVVAIPNGYDPDDFPSPLPEPPSDRFVISYAGTVFKLTSPRAFIAALRLVFARAPKLGQRLTVNFAGRIVDTEAHLFADADKLNIERLGYLSKADVLSLQAASHLNLSTLDDVPGVDRIYPGKTFELMYLRRPVLTVAPPGALAELTRQHDLGPVFGPDDAEGIAAFLIECLQNFVAGTYVHQSSPRDIDRFHRDNQAAEFARVFEMARTQAARAT